ncbi:MAG: hypothetical protein WBA83_02415 [Burkholderiaceae bacterium]
MTDAKTSAATFNMLTSSKPFFRHDSIPGKKASATTTTHARLGRCG